MGGNLTVSGTSNRLTTMAEAYSGSGDAYFQVNRDDGIKSRWRFATSGANFELQDNYNVRIPLSIVGNTMATTIGGNLTVSGTAVVDSLSKTYAAASNATAIAVTQANSGGNGLYTSALVYIANSGNNPYLSMDDKFVFKQSGNLLIDTTTDGGQKLQVKGGVRVIDSGNDSNYITIGSGNDAPAGGNSFIAQTGTLVVGTAASASLILRTGGTTALTLDSSQNATFAGSVTTGTPNGGTAGAWKLGVRVAATTTLDTTQYLQVDIGGTLYKVALVTS